MLKIKPDGIVKEKVTIRLDLASDTTETGYMNIFWHSLTDYGGGSYNASITTLNKQFTDMIRNYRFYYIYGLKIHLIPVGFGQIGGNTRAIRSGYIGSLNSTSTSTETETSIRNCKDWKPIDPTQ